MQQLAEADDREPAAARLAIGAAGLVLGMLLLVRERCVQSKGAPPSLVNAKGVVKKVLEVANFQKLFPER